MTVRHIRGRVMRSLLAAFGSRSELTTREAYDLLGADHEECSVYRALRRLHEWGALSRGPPQRGGPRRHVVWKANATTRAWLRLEWDGQPRRGTRAKPIT